MITKTPIEFSEFPKMCRMSRECIITEKIYGTNGQIYIGEDGEFLVGSRSRWITPDQDNHGFARWAYANRDELLKLGPGRHFGEWWGSGIQRGYGLTKGEKRWSLFNALRWHVYGLPPQRIPCSDAREVKMQEVAPICCDVVPVLYRGLFDTAQIESNLEHLRKEGSLAAPGFMNPEGVVCFHIAGNFGMKKTIEKDEQPKTQSK